MSVVLFHVETCDNNKNVILGKCPETQKHRHFAATGFSKGAGIDEVRWGAVVRPAAPAKPIYDNAPRGGASPRWFNQGCVD